jgi:hypothetical protein
VPGQNPVALVYYTHLDIHGIDTLGIGIRRIDILLDFHTIVAHPSVCHTDLHHHDYIAVDTRPVLLIDIQEVALVLEIEPRLTRLELLLVQ